MSGAARPRKPLVLVSDDVEPPHWDAAGEDEIVSRLAACQDVWGRNCFTPGQNFAMRQAAYALAVNKTQIFGAIGSFMGGFGTLLQEFGAHVEVFEADAQMYEINAASPNYLGKLIKLERWTPGQPALKANRFHRLCLYNAFSAVTDVDVFATEVSAALKPGGFLYLDEIWANDRASAKVLASACSLWPGAQSYKAKGEVLGLLGRELELRSTNEANRLVKADIRNGLVHAQSVAQKLKQIPEPSRKQRLIALTQELQRAIVMYDALERQAIVATRFIFQKPKKF
jgi:hypothetical protein